MTVKILPSLLAADVGNLESGARKAEAAGADALHLDIMDGHFVPNLSMGPAVVEMARRVVQIPLSVHLMMTHPEEHLTSFIDAGADSLLIHIEAECDVLEALDIIRRLGVKPGITLNPETSAEMVFPVLDLVDEVLCMTVHPGFGGQGFMPEVLPKIRALRDHAKMTGKGHLDIIVDGGINTETGAECAAHGANVLIAGTSLYGADDMTAELLAMREKAAEALVL